MNEVEAKLVAGRQEEQTLGARVCTCHVIWLTPEVPLPAGATCICNTFTVNPPTSGARREVTSERKMTGQACQCDRVCTCNTVGRAGHYWHPN